MPVMVGPTVEIRRHSFNEEVSRLTGMRSSVPFQIKRIIKALSTCGAQKPLRHRIHNFFWNPGPLGGEKGSVVRQVNLRGTDYCDSQPVFPENKISTRCARLTFLQDR